MGRHYIILSENESYLTPVESYSERDLVQNSKVSTKTFEYKLAQKYTFNEPHYAKLVCITLAAHTTAAFVDFVASQSVGGVWRPLLGVQPVAHDSSCVENLWVPILNNEIPEIGLCTIEHLKKRGAVGKQTIGTPISIVFYVAPARCIDK